MLVRIPSVSKDSRLRLLQAAAEFAKTAPWDELEDSDAFAVRDATTGMIGCCCILGALGEVFGLSVHRGLTGFDMYERIQDRDTDPAIMLEQDGLLAEFVPKRELEPSDRRWLAETGPAMKTPAGYSKFRSFLPGYAPWPIDEGEAEFLTRALRSGLHLASSGTLGERRHTLSGRRVYSFYDWTSAEMTSAPAPTLFEPDPPPIGPLPAPVLDGPAVTAALRARHTTDVWQLGVFRAPSVIDEGDRRPFYVRMTLVVEARSGYVIHFEIAPPEDAESSFALDTLIAATQKSASLPATIELDNARLRGALRPALKALGIRSRVLRSLPGFEEARDSLIEHVRNPDWRGP